MNMVRFSDIATACEIVILAIAILSAIELVRKGVGEKHYQFFIILIPASLTLIIARYVSPESGLNKLYTFENIELYFHVLCGVFLLNYILINIATSDS